MSSGDSRYRKVRVEPRGGPSKRCDSKSKQSLGRWLVELA